ncbi:MAG TPA: hypothetical protein VJ783_02725 [Pirellulales bacterium]|nr:hypothetical protein [Pirellulales bacterium]
MATIESLLTALKAGVDLVYVVDAHSQSVFAYTADQPNATLSGDDELAFLPPLDGLRIRVRRLFDS